MGTRVLYVHGLSAIGGAERDLLGLLKHLDRRVWQPMVACPGTGPFREAVESCGVPVFPLILPPWRKVSSLLSRYRGVRLLRALLAKVDPALIHVNDLWWVPHTVRAVAGLPRRIPVVAHVRQEAQPAKVRQYGLDRADHVIVVSQHVEQGLHSGGLSTQRVSTIYSGVDLAALTSQEERETVRARCGIPRGATVVGTIANLLPLKGYEVMLEALPTIVAAYPTVHYLIVGAGDAGYLEKLTAMTRDRMMTERVHFVGFQRAVAPYLSLMDLYVHPTLKEAFGLAVVEAMAMGKAVVATEIGGIPEIVSQGDTGLLVPPGNAEQLSAAVVRLLQEPARCRQMGERGKALVRERFGLETSVAQIAQQYRHVLAEDERRG